MSSEILHESSDLPYREEPCDFGDVGKLASDRCTFDEFIHRIFDGDLLVPAVAEVGRYMDEFMTCFLPKMGIFIDASINPEPFDFDVDPKIFHAFWSVQNLSKLFVEGRRVNMLYLKNVLTSEHVAGGWKHVPILTEFANSLMPGGILIIVNFLDDFRPEYFQQAGLKVIRTYGIGCGRGAVYIAQKPAS